MGDDAIVKNCWQVWVMTLLLAVRYILRPLAVCTPVPLMSCAAKALSHLAIALEFQPALQQGHRRAQNARGDGLEIGEGAV